MYKFLIEFVDYAGVLPREDFGVVNSTKYGQIGNGDFNWEV
jgi:hypothetical protein